MRGLNGQFNARLQRLERGSGETTDASVPVPSVGDEGKVIAVDENGKYTLENAPSCLPEYGNDDVGKVLSISRTPKMTTLIPQQNVTTNTEILALGRTVYAGIVENVNISDIKEEELYTLLCDGVEYEISFYDGLAFDLSAGVGLLLNENTLYMITFSNNETHNIELTGNVDITQPLWCGDSIYIINVSFDNYLQSYSCSETYDDIMSMYKSGIKLYTNCDLTNRNLSELRPDVTNTFYSSLITVLYDSGNNKHYLVAKTLSISNENILLVSEIGRVEIT